MKRVWAHLLAGTSVLAGACAVMAACVHDDSTLFVQDVLLPPLVTQGQECVFTNDPTQTELPSGILDIGLRSNYVAEFLLGNQMVAESNSQQLQTETSTITVQGAIVRITDPAGNQLSTFTRLAATTVYPSSGTTPGYAPIGLEIVDQNTLAGAAVQGPLSQNGTARVVTYVKFFGNTLGGRSVESDEFEFPVDICNGCLVTFSTSDINPNAKTPNCLGNGSSSTNSSSLPIPCFFGEDQTVDCASCLQFPICNPNANTLVAPSDGGAD